MIGKVIGLKDRLMILLMNDFHNNIIKGEYLINKLEEQADHIMIGDVIELVRHPDDPFYRWLARIRGRSVPNRFRNLFYSMNCPQRPSSNDEYGIREWNKYKCIEKAVVDKLLDEAYLQRPVWIDEGF